MQIVNPNVIQTKRNSPMSWLPDVLSTGMGLYSMFNSAAYQKALSRQADAQAKAMAANTDFTRSQIDDANKTNINAAAVSGEGSFKVGDATGFVNNGAVSFFDPSGKEIPVTGYTDQMKYVANTLRYTPPDMGSAQSTTPVQPSLNSDNSATGFTPQSAPANTGNTAVDKNILQTNAINMVANPKTPPEAAFSILGNYGLASQPTPEAKKIFADALQAPVQVTDGAKLSELLNTQKSIKFAMNQLVRDKQFDPNVHKWLIEAANANAEKGLKILAESSVLNSGLSEDELSAVIKMAEATKTKNPTLMQEALHIIGGMPASKQAAVINLAQVASNMDISASGVKLAEQQLAFEEKKFAENIRQFNMGYALQKETAEFQRTIGLASMDIENKKLQQDILNSNRTYASNCLANLLSLKRLNSSDKDAEITGKIGIYSGEIKALIATKNNIDKFYGNAIAAEFDQTRKAQLKGEYTRASKSIADKIEETSQNVKTEIAGVKSKFTQPEIDSAINVLLKQANYSEAGSLLTGGVNATDNSYAGIAFKLGGIIKGKVKALDDKNSSAIISAGINQYNKMNPHNPIPASLVNDPDFVKYFNQGFNTK